MALSYYGFDFGGYPKTSRLFNQDVMDKAQQAYNTGMQQFVPYTAEAAPVEQAPAANPLSPNAWLTNLQEGANLSPTSSISREGDNRFVVSAASPSQRGRMEQFYVDQYGNLAGSLGNAAINASDLSDTQMNAYNRLLAQMRMGSNA